MPPWQEQMAISIAHPRVEQLSPLFRPYNGRPRRGGLFGSVVAAMDANYQPQPSPDNIERAGREVARV